MRYKRHAQLFGHIGNMSDNLAHSAFAEAFNGLQMNSIRQSEILGAAMGNQTLTQVFSTEDKLSLQLSQASKRAPANPPLNY